MGENNEEFKELMEKETELDSVKRSNISDMPTLRILATLEDGKEYSGTDIARYTGYNVATLSRRFERLDMKGMISRRKMYGAILNKITEKGKRWLEYLRTGKR
jgi:DNA-binding MarR family transcriptional regulator